jgi:hypothetical protein
MFPCRRLALGAPFLAGALAAVLAGAIAAPLLADDVLLKNGRSFEGVIAVADGERVAIRLPGGVIVLPMAQVARIDSRASAFEEYLSRRDQLRRGGAGAAAWLELARWARRQSLDQGAREAALVAADLEPRLAGLEPVLRAYGYAFDAELERWITYEDAMRRRGFVQVAGRWLSREEVEERRRTEREERLQAAAEHEAWRAAHLERAAREVELAAARLDLERARAAASAAATGPYVQGYGWTMPVFVFPFFPVVVPPGPAPPPHPSADPMPRDLAPPPAREAINSLDLFERQPGSLFPARSTSRR